MLSDTTAQLYGNYDFEISNLVHRLMYPYPGHSGRPVLHVFATPERAFAQVEKKLRTRPNDAQKVFPLPFVSIQRLNEVFDPTRAHRARLPDRYYSSDARRRYTGMDWPIPVTLPYQISFWAKQIDDINRLYVQWMLLFDHTPRRYLTVDHPFPMGEKIVHSRTTEVAHPPMTPEAEEQRVIRSVITLMVDGWVTRAALETGIIEEITVDLFDSDDMITETDRLGRVVVP